MHASTPLAFTSPSPPRRGFPFTRCRTCWIELRAAGCIREDGKDILIAADDRLVQYEAYLDLKRRYQTNDRVPVEVQTVSADEKKQAVKRLLTALGTGPDDDEENVLRSQYQKYIELQRRFEGS